MTAAVADESALLPFARMRPPELAVAFARSLLYSARTLSRTSRGAKVDESLVR